MVSYFVSEQTIISLGVFLWFEIKRYANTWDHVYHKKTF